jgi:hypothetical protein
MTPTAALIHAAAMLDTDARLGREPRSEGILRGTLAAEAPLPPDARDAARRHIAQAAFLRSFAVHEDTERAAVLEDCAIAQDVLAEVAMASLPRLDS